MIFLYIYLGLFVATLVYAVYDSHKKAKYIPFVDHKFLGLKLKDPMWFLVLVSVIVAPITIFVLFADLCVKLYYRNRPRPVKGSYRKNLKVDTVLDETNSTVSLAEYNRKHGTNFTLADVYGRKYVASLTPEELASIRDCSDTLKISDDIKGDSYAEIVICYANARMSNNYLEFVKYLTNDSVLTRVEKGRCFGVMQIVDYFKRMHDKREEAKDSTDYEVLLCQYNNHAALKEMVNNSIIYTLFLIEDNKIKHMTITPVHLHWGIGYSPLDRPVYSKEFVAKLKGAQIEPKANHFSCPKCGKLSEELTWKRVEIPVVYHGYIGDMSICPVCGCEVEFFPEIRARYEEPQSLEDDEKQDLPRSPFFPRILGASFSFDEVLKDTSCWKDLDKDFMIKPHPLDTQNPPMSLQECAKVFHPIFLRRLYEQDKDQFAKLKACYQKAFDDGIIAAVNNLAILCVNYEENNAQEGIDLWHKGIELGDEHSIANLFNYYWGEENYPAATHLLRRHAATPFCAYNLAILYFFGQTFKGYFLKEDKVKARNYLEAIIEKEPYESEFDNDIASNAHRFLEVFDLLSNWSQYGSSFYSGLRRKVEDHKYHLGHIYKDGELFEGIHWPKNYELAFQLPEEKGMGGETNISLYDGAKDKEEKKIFDFMSIDKTDKAAFEVYLLYNAKTVLPVFWHGGYIVRKYVFYRETISEIDELKGIDMSHLTYDIRPEVKIEGNVATIECTWWNDWKGLVRETFSFTWDGDKATNFESKERVLFAYDCGILF